MALQINRNFDERSNKWRLELVGEVDISTSPELRQVLEDVFSGKEGHMVLDLLALDYMDSTGLGVIIGAYGRMKEKGYSLTMINPKSNIEKLLRITSLDRIFLPVQ